MNMDFGALLEQYSDEALERILLKWYDSNPFDFNRSRMGDIIDLFQWCYFNSSDLALLPRSLRLNRIQKICNKHNISYEKLNMLLKSTDKIVCGQMPLIIAFEGVDGSGKSIQIKELEKELIKRGYKVGILNFPVYSGFFGKEVGNFLSGKNDVDANSVDVKSMCLWYALDRWDALKSISLDAYDIVLMNRSTLSSAIYQSCRVSERESQEIEQWIFKLEFEKLKILSPDLYFIFDVSETISYKNVLKKGEREYLDSKTDVYEKSESFIQKVRKKYLDYANKYGFISCINCMQDEHTMYSVRNITEQVLGELEQWIPLYMMK